MKNKTALLLLAAVCGTVSADIATDSWAKDLKAWRDQRAQKLTAAEGWMSLTGLEPIDEGSNPFGGAADNTVHLKGVVPAHLGVLKRHGQEIRLSPPPGGFPPELQLDGKPPQPQVLNADDTPQPTRMTAGTLVFFVIHRSDRFYLRVKDAHSPTITSFQHLNWYAPDPAFRIHATWTPYTPPKSIAVASIIGTQDQMPVPGVATFTLGGKSYQLEPVLEDPGATDLFFILHDTTSPKTSYGASRFLYTAFPSNGLDKPGDLEMDFNRLQNPPCAYTEYATCPLPPKQNRLQVALPVGEKKYHD
jgi:uncharacterized protein (DUF1684 family)